MKKSIIFLAAIAAFFSCAKDNSVNNTTTEKTFSVTLTASAPSSEDVPSPASADTKTTLVDGNNKKFVHWSQGDAIKMLFFPDHTHQSGYSGSNGVFTADIKTLSSVTATFKTDSWSWGFGSDYVDARLMLKGIAVYPSTAIATSSKPDGIRATCDTKVSYILPSSQKTVENNIESELNFSYAEVDRNDFVNSINGTATPRLSFKNACAIIELTMPSTLDKKVTSISLVSNSGVSLTGNGSVRLTGYNNVVADPFGVDVTEGDGVTLLSDADGFKAGAKYYAVVWPGNHEDGLTIEFKAEDGTVATKTTGKVTLEASKVKPYTFNKGLEFIAPVQEEFDFIYADGSTGNEVNSNIVGVVIFRGNPKEKFNDPDLPDQYCNGLAISTKNVMTSWGGSSAVSNQPADAKVAITASDIPNTKGGYTIKNVWTNNNFNLPIYNNAAYANLSSCNTSGWYLGTKNEWSYIHSNLEEINALLAAAGADAIQTASSENSASSRNTIWMPFWCTSGGRSYYAITGYFDSNGNLKFTSNYNYSYSRIARPIFAF